MRYLIILLLAGCAASQWSKPGAGTAEWSQDLYVCKRDALPLFDSRDGWAYAAMVNECLNVRGWRQL